MRCINHDKKCIEKDPMGIYDMSEHVEHQQNRDTKNIFGNESDALCLLHT